MAANHNTSLYVLVIISNSFLVFGPFFLYDTMVSLQPLLIGEPCPRNASFEIPRNCCESCIGFNPLEYNILVGLPLAISTIAGLISGFIIDRYGYCLFNFVTALSIIVGAVIRAIGGRRGLSHNTSYTLMLVGSFIVDNAFTIVYLVQLYVCARWFSGRYLSTVVGLTLSVSLSGSLVAYYVNPILVTSVGLENTLWYAVPIGGSAVLAASGLCIAEKLAKGRDVEILQCEKTNLSFATIKSFSASYWLVSIVIAFSWILFYSFIGNSVAYQVDVFHVEYKLASFSSGAMYITKIGFSPIAGWLAGRFNIYGPMSLVGCCFNIAGLGMLVAAVGPPIVIIVLMGLGFAIVYTIMAAVIIELVSFDKLATANGIMNALIGLGIGAGDITVGAIAETSEERLVGWLNSAVFLLAMAVAETLMVVILVVLDSRSSKRILWMRSSGRRGSEEEEKYESLELHERKESRELVLSLKDEDSVEFRRSSSDEERSHVSERAPCV